MEVDLLDESRELTDKYQEVCSQFIKDKKGMETHEKERRAACEAAI